jgi:hypothetical protein
MGLPADPRCGVPGAGRLLRAVAGGPAGLLVSGPGAGKRGMPSMTVRCWRTAATA